MVLTVSPGRLPHFGLPADAFVLITNSVYADQVKIVRDGAYATAQVVTWDSGDDLATLIRHLPEPAHILVLSPKRTFMAPSPEVLGQRQVCVVACHATPTSRPELQSLLTAIEATDLFSQQDSAAQVSRLASGSPRLTLRDARYDTAAIMQHWRGQHAWYTCVEPLTTWGSVQTVPNGTLNLVLPGAFDAQGSTMQANAHLPLDGEIALAGYPIVQAGRPIARWHNQRHIHKTLSVLTEAAVIATVSDGLITRLRATHPQGQPAVTLLYKLFSQQEQYRTITAIGLGLNTAFAPLPGNHEANAVCGGTDGALHIGLGLLPFTQYHITVVCPGLTLVGKDRTVLAGPALRTLRRYGENALLTAAGD
jgi:hypothetical protein